MSTTWGRCEFLTNRQSFDGLEKNNDAHQQRQHRGHTTPAIDHVFAPVLIPFPEEAISAWKDGWQVTARGFRVPQPIMYIHQLLALETCFNGTMSWPTFPVTRPPTNSSEQNPTPMDLDSFFADVERISSPNLIDTVKTPALTDNCIAAMYNTAATMNMKVPFYASADDKKTDFRMGLGFGAFGGGEGYSISSFLHRRNVAWTSLVPRPLLPCSANSIIRATTIMATIAAITQRMSWYAHQEKNGLKSSNQDIAAPSVVILCDTNSACRYVHHMIREYLLSVQQSTLDASNDNHHVQFAVFSLCYPIESTTRTKRDTGGYIFLKKRIKIVQKTRLPLEIIVSTPLCLQHLINEGAIGNNTRQQPLMSLDRVRTTLVCCPLTPGGKIPVLEELPISASFYERRWKGALRKPFDDSVVDGGDFATFAEVLKTLVMSPNTDQDVDEGGSCRYRSQVVLMEESLALFSTDQTPIDSEIEAFSGDTLISRLEALDIILERPVKIHGGAPLTVPRCSRVGDVHDKNKLSIITTTATIAADDDEDEKGLTTESAITSVRTVVEYIETGHQRLKKIENLLHANTTLKLASRRLECYASNPNSVKEWPKDGCLGIMTSTRERNQALVEMCELSLGVDYHDDSHRGLLQRQSVRGAPGWALDTRSTKVDIEFVKRLMRARDGYLSHLWSRTVVLTVFSVEDLVGYFCLSLTVMAQDSVPKTRAEIEYLNSGGVAKISAEAGVHPQHQSIQTDPFLNPRPDQVLSLCCPFPGVCDTIVLGNSLMSSFPMYLSFLTSQFTRLAAPKPYPATASTWLRLSHGITIEDLPKVKTVQLLLKRTDNYSSTTLCEMYTNTYYRILYGSNDIAPHAVAEPAVTSDPEVSKEPSSSYPAEPGNSHQNAQQTESDAAVLGQPNPTNIPRKVWESALRYGEFGQCVLEGRRYHAPKEPFILAIGAECAIYDNSKSKKRGLGGMNERVKLPSGHPFLRLIEDGTTQFASDVQVDVQLPGLRRLMGFIGTGNNKSRTKKRLIELAQQLQIMESRNKDSRKIIPGNETWQTSSDEEVDGTPRADLPRGFYRPLTPPKATKDESVNSVVEGEDSSSTIKPEVVRKKRRGFDRDTDGQVILRSIFDEDRLAKRKALSEYNKLAFQNEYLEKVRGVKKLAMVQSSKALLEVEKKINQSKWDEAMKLAGSGNASAGTGVGIADTCQLEVPSSTSQTKVVEDPALPAMAQNDGLQQTTTMPMYNAQMQNYYQQNSQQQQAAYEYQYQMMTPEQKLLYQQQWQQYQQQQQYYYQQQMAANVQHQNHAPETTNDDDANEVATQNLFHQLPPGF